MNTYVDGKHAQCAPDDLISISDQTGDWGLTKREYFAVRLMAARIAADPDDTMSRELQAGMAVKDADALIAALNGTAL